MKAGEIIRLIVFIITGAALMFLGQPWIYSNRMIRVRDVPLDSWISNYYIPGALLVFGISVFSTLIWCVMAARARAKGAEEVFRWKLVWWLLLLLPVLSVCAAIYFFNRSDDARLSLTGFFVIDAIFWLFWLPTVTSSPGDLKYIPPGAFFIRRLIGS